MRLRTTVLATALMLAPICANASVVMYIERISDTVATITGTGSSTSDKNFLRFYNVASLGSTGGDISSGDLELGGLAVSSAGTFNNVVDSEFRIYFTGAPAIGSTFSGALQVTLDTGMWASAGSTGLMGNGQGTWSMLAPQISAVPLPAGLPLLVAGLGAFGLVRKRRKG